MAGLNALVVGGGMYVTGRGAKGYRGTIAPALLEARRTGLIDRIGILTTNAASATAAAGNISALAAEMTLGTQCAALAGAEPAADFAPDVVIVSVPDHLHGDVCIPWIERGVHCLVVKPMADTPATARAMAAAAEKAGVVAQVEFHKRLDESNLLLREAVRRDELGELLYATVEYSQRKTVPRDAFRKWAGYSNIFQYLGVHYVDLLTWATAFEPARVTAWGQKAYLSGEGIDTWDAMQVVIEWRKPDGSTFVSTHATNWIDPDETSAMSDQKINVVGTRGRYQADQKHRGVQLVTDGVGAQDINPYFTSVWHDTLGGTTGFHGYGIRSVMQFLDDVVRYHDGGVTLERLNAVRPSFQNCISGCAVVAAARASLEAGSIPIEVEL